MTCVYKTNNKAPNFPTNAELLLFIVIAVVVAVVVAVVAVVVVPIHRNHLYEITVCKIMTHESKRD